MREMGMDTVTVQESKNLACAKGRSGGALFLAFFGECWLLLSAAAFHVVTWTVEVTLLGAVLAMVTGAVTMLRQVPRREQVDAGRRWVNVVQWVAILAVFEVTRRLHHPDAAFPLLALVVGLHFFALPRSFRHRSNVLTGVVLCADAVVCPLVWRGDTMVGVVTLIAGATLWIGAGWALMTAARLLRAWRQGAAATALAAG